MGWLNLTLARIHQTLWWECGKIPRSLRVVAKNIVLVGLFLFPFFVLLSFSSSLSLCTMYLRGVWVWVQDSKSKSMAHPSLMLYYLSQRRLPRSFFFIPTSLALVTCLLILFYISTTSNLFAHHPPRPKSYSRHAHLKQGQGGHSFSSQSQRLTPPSNLGSSNGGMNASDSFLFYMLKCMFPCTCFN